MDSWMEQFAQVAALQGFNPYKTVTGEWIFAKGLIEIAAREPTTDAERATLIRTLIGAGLVFPSDN